MSKKQKLMLKKGDQVKIITGSQKGLRGQILFINYKKSTAIIDTAKSRTKMIIDIKEKEQKKEKQIPIPIHISNLMAWDTQLNAISRLGYKMVENKKERYFKKSGNLVSEKFTTLNNDNG